MRNIFEYYNDNDYLAHHGILGQKWGIRRFQNADGSLTNAGKSRYSSNISDGSHETSNKQVEQIRQAIHRDRIKNDAYYKLENRTDMSREQKDAEYAKKMKESFDRMRNNCKTDEEKDHKVRSYDNAKDNDRWNLDFLEAIQNSGILHDGNTKAMLIEYADFLDNPDAYWRDGRNRLYGV